MRRRQCSRVAAGKLSLKLVEIDGPPNVFIWCAITREIPLVLIAALPSVIFRSPNHPNADVREKVLPFIIAANLKNPTARVFHQFTREIKSRIALDIRPLFDDYGAA